MNVFKYNDYRKFLKEAIVAKKAVLPHLTFSKIADEILVQRSYLSQVLAGKCNLSSDQLYLIGQKIGLKEKENDYLLLLLDIERCQVKARKSHLEQRKNQLKDSELKSEKFMQRDPVKINDNQYARYYCDPYCSLVHMYLVIPKYRKDLSLIQSRLNISEQKLAEALEVLENCSVIEIAKKGEIKMLKDTMHLSDESFLSRANAIMFRLKAIDSQQRLPNSSDYFFTAAISANDDTKILIKQKFLEFLSEISSFVERAPSEEVFHLNFDLFTP